MAGETRTLEKYTDPGAYERAEEQLRMLNSTLRQKAEELQMILNVLPVGIFIADDPGCTSIHPNPAGASMLGVTLGTNTSKRGSEAARLPFRVLREGIEIPTDELPIQKAARTGEAVLGERMDICRNDGSLVRLLAYATPLFDDKLRVRGCVGMGIDISEHWRTGCAGSPKRETPSS
jgi:PAS domain-containing protein